ncbi:MAG: hypothetical protein IH996_04695 [Proteobacteria bacterium]|nr:hypothetical protein [Pseudomonadota bacterium]
MTSHAHPLTYAGGDDFVIGYHIGPFGRFARLIFAVYYLIFFVVNPLVLNSRPLNDFLPFAGETALWVLALAAIYFVAFYLLGELLLSRMNPWTGTLFFLGGPTLIGLLGWMPQPMQVAFGVYVALSLILIFFMKYGGCEVIALPSLILGQRYTMYCPYNAIDAVERGVTPEKGKQAEPYFALLSLSITLFVGSWFIFVERGRLLERYGLEWHIDQRWVLLLVVPVLHLAYRAWRAHRQSGQWWNSGIAKYGLGASILALYVLVFLNLANGGMLWMGAMGLGGLYVIFEVFQFATGRKKFKKKDASDDLTTPARTTPTGQASE